MTTSKGGASLKLVLTVLFLGVLMGALDIAIVGPALPALRAWFRVDDRAGAWIFTEIARKAQELSPWDRRASPA